MAMTELITPGASPRSWYALFEGGPMDGQRAGLVDVTEPPQLIDWADGRYRLLSTSNIDPELDLTGEGILRGCKYAWEVLSRAETFRPGSRESRLAQ
jgi:hypothetical protein